MSALEDLANELGMSPEELRTRLTESDEALQPSYLTTTASGSVSAQFSGHVKASGLDLDGGPVTALSAINAVEWLRHTDNALVAYVLAYEGSGGSPERQLDISLTVPGDALPGTGPLIQLERPGTGQQIVSVGTGGTPTRKLIDAAGVSDFLQKDDYYAQTAKTANQAVGSGSRPAITFSGVDANVGDPSGMWSAGSPTKLTISQPGLYLVLGALNWSASGANARQAYLGHNGALFVEFASQPAAEYETVIPVSGFRIASAGDYFELYGYQESGGNLNASPGSFLAAILMRPT